MNVCLGVRLVMADRPLETARCIYCRETKPLTDFNRGHVLPRSFGTFNRNLVLHGRECEACNSVFGNTLERLLARDSKEGVDRIEFGCVDQSKEGRRFGSRVSFSLRGGPVDGAPMEIDPSSPGELRLRPKRAVGFGPASDGPWTWYSVDSLPTVEELATKGLCVAISGGLSQAEFESVAAKMGMARGLPFQIVQPEDPDGMVDTTSLGVIDRDIKRAVAKIAFQYLAFEYPAFAYMSEFDDIRSFICTGRTAGHDPVNLSQRPLIGNLPQNAQLIAHAITVSWDARAKRVLGQVTLFGWMRYEVTLSAAPFVITPTCINSGRLFDPFQREIFRLTSRSELAMPVTLRKLERASRKSSHTFTT